MQERIHHLQSLPAHCRQVCWQILRRCNVAAIIVCISATLQVSARDRNGIQYGAGLIVNVPFPESQVTQVVQDVVQNGIIRGTKEYNKDAYVAGAAAASSTRVFPVWTEAGKVFYKVREHALDPRNFKNSGDVGTLAVRYVVQPQGDKATVLRIDAVFVEDFRHTVHPSNGSVESAEYKDIHDRLDAMASIQQETAQAEKEKQAQEATRIATATSASLPPSATDLATRTIESAPATSAAKTDDGANTKPENLEDRVKELRRQVERLVKAPGAPLKSAPFHTATTLQSLPAGSEVLVVITTTYWLGVETHEGQHGWMLRDDLELVP